MQRWSRPGPCLGTMALHRKTWSRSQGLRGAGLHCAPSCSAAAPNLPACGQAYFLTQLTGCQPQKRALGGRGWKDSGLVPSLLLRSP